MSLIGKTLSDLICPGIMRAMLSWGEPRGFTPLFLEGTINHDGSLLRHHVPFLPALPPGPVRKGHGLRGARRGPVQQARRHLDDEPVRPGADPGRTRADPVRVE